MSTVYRYPGGIESGQTVRVSSGAGSKLEAVVLRPPFGGLPDGIALIEIPETADIPAIRVRVPLDILEVVE